MVHPSQARTIDNPVEQERLLAQGWLIGTPKPKTKDAKRMRLSRAQRRAEGWMSLLLWLSPEDVAAVKAALKTGEENYDDDSRKWSRRMSWAQEQNAKGQKHLKWITNPRVRPSWRGCKACEYQAALEWSVPSRWQPQLFRDLDRLQALEAAAAPDPDKAQAMKARALHAGAAKVNGLHAAIDAGVELYRLQLVNWTGTATARAIWLTKRIYPDGKTDRSGKPCGWRTVYDHLNTLQL
ncbi:hypothetical protein Q9L58_010712 [Maublancomyces gigas]|uniref:Uncharacterized protein n=1 Tax=Discina gigas TaxID=1032678 RepID=A0ABR3G3D3_9PEZI